MATQKKYYEILGVEREASATTIKRAFYKRARKVHPDVNKSPEAEAKFKELNEAYSVLSDEQKRRNYDMFGTAEGPFGTSSSGFGFGFEDLFSDMFGFGRNQGGVPQEDIDIYLEQRITPKEQIEGGTFVLEYMRHVRCETCEGTGSLSKSEPTTCDTCGGRGVVQQVARTIFGDMTTQTTCPACHGSGTTIPDPCPACNGQKTQAKTVQYTLEIPPGIDFFKPYIVSNEGSESPGSAGTGNLVVLWQLDLPKPFVLTRQGIAAPVESNVLTMISGGTISLPTLLDEDNTNFEISSYTKDHELLQVDGVGLLGSDGKRGRILYELHAVWPHNLSQEELETLSSIAHNHKD